MTSPILALRAAIRAAVLADADAALILGRPAEIVDEPPRAAEPVYLVFAECEARDWSTATDRGHEQALTVAIWARPGSAVAALRLADRLWTLLDGADLDLDGHRLVRLSGVETRAARDPKSDLTRVTLALAAVTETAA